MMKRFLLIVAAALAIGGEAYAQVVNQQYRQAGTGAISRTFQDKARDTVHVKDFGAKCDGTTNDAVTIQKAIDYAQNSSVRRRVLLPGGVCKITATLSITANSHITLEGEGRFSTYIWHTAGSGTDGALKVDGGQGASACTGACYAVTNKPGVTIRNLALGSNAGPALLNYRASNVIYQNLLLYSAHGSYPFLSINGGAMNFYQHIQLDAGNTALPSSVSGVVTVTAGAYSLQIVSTDATPTVVTEHVFDDVRNGGSQLYDAINIDTAGLPWSTFGIHFSNSFIKSTAPYGGWKVNGADVYIVNSNFESAGGTPDALWLYSGNIWVSNFRAANGRLALNRTAALNVWVNQGSFDKVHIDAAPDSLSVTNTTFDGAAFTGSIPLTDVANLVWNGNSGGGNPMVIGANGTSAGFSGNHSIFKIHGGATVGQVPGVQLKRNVAAQVQSWTAAIQSNKALDFYDDTGSALQFRVLPASAGGGVAIGGGAPITKYDIQTIGPFDFPSTAAGTSSDIAVAMTGAAVGSPVVLVPSTTCMPANTSLIAWASAADQVTVRLNNYSAGAVDPASCFMNAAIILQ